MVCKYHKKNIKKLSLMMALNERCPNA